MNYTIQASQRTPALIIYLIDISASMNMVLTIVAELTSCMMLYLWRSAKWYFVQPKEIG